jgi:hypothetical protein
MVYNAQNDLVSGFCPSSRDRKETRSKGPNRVSPSLHLRMETDPVSETLCFLVFRITDDEQSQETKGF